MLEIHFLNVGHGDCTIIRHPSGRITMIDINNGGEIDDETFGEIRSELRRSSASLGAILVGLGTPSYPSALPSSSYRSGVLGGLLDVPTSSGLGSGIFSSGASHVSLASAFANLLSARPDKKRELKDAGYEIALTDPVEYHLRNFGRKPIFRYIQTHPDLDHMRGLSALREAGIEIINFWDTNHNKRPDLINGSDRCDWNEYCWLRSGRSSTFCAQRFAGDNGQFWNHDPYSFENHDGIEILSPTPSLNWESNQREDYNKLSYVLKISYANQRIILGGDADKEAWQRIADQYWLDMRCDVLKASHHGRDSGYLAEAVKWMNPTYTIVSVGKKPETDASNKYRHYCDNIWSTRWYGNLIAKITILGRFGGLLNPLTNRAFMKHFDYYKFSGILEPGVACLGGIVILFPNALGIRSIQGVSFGGLGFFVILAYVLGHLVQAVGNLVEKLWWHIFRGEPTDWLRRDSGGILSPEQCVELERCARLRLCLPSLTISKLSSKEWLAITRQVYAEVAGVGRAGRVDIFDAIYGLHRGLAAALIVVAVASLLISPARPTVAALATAGALLGLYRMHRFGRHYARELFVQFLQLPRKQRAEEPKK